MSDPDYLKTLLENNAGRHVSYVPRLYTVLCKYGIADIDILSNMSNIELIDLKYIGPISAIIIHKAIKEHERNKNERS